MARHYGFASGSALGPCAMNRAVMNLAQRKARKKLFLTQKEDRVCQGADVAACAITVFHSSGGQAALRVHAAFGSFQLSAHGLSER